MDNPLKKANELIGRKNSDLQTIFEKIRLLSSLNKKVEKHLDPAIIPYCQVANLVDKKLVLIVANGSIATQIRYQMGDILRKFRQDKALSHILSIECKVRPSQSRPFPEMHSLTAKSMEPLSPQTSKIVKTIAESIDDPKLKEVMMKIARRVEKEK